MIQNIIWEKYIPDRLKTALKQIDWLLLILLAGVTQNRFFSLKIIIIVAITIIRPSFSYLKRNTHIYFYVCMVLLCIAQFLFTTGDYSFPYLKVVLYGCLGWLLMFLVALQFWRAYHKNDASGLIKTVSVYFWINIFLSFINLVAVFSHTRSLNPFDAPLEPMYGISSGDHISGLYGYHLFDFTIGDFSSVNSTVLAMLFLFFFMHRKWLHASVALVFFLCTTSNINSLALMGFIPLILLLEPSRKKYLAPACISVLGILMFYQAVSPRNLDYVRAKIAGYFIKDDSSAAMKRWVPRRVHTARELEIISRMPYNPDLKSGKIVAFRQTVDYLKTNPAVFIFGAGAGRFSSHLAMIASDSVGDKSRLFRPLLFAASEYRENHGGIIYNINELPVEYHSVMQHPSSLYNQLLGEYGITGLLLFLALYIGFFVKHFRSGAGKYLILFLLFSGILEYVFDTFCIVFVFELLMLAGMKAKGMHTHKPELPGRVSSGGT